MKKLYLTLVAGLLWGVSYADDIDIFLSPPAGGSSAPNVLFVLDNTSNWSRQSQQWPDKDAQGQSEVNAIKTAINGLERELNVGLMMFVTRGDANDNGGYVRADIRPMDDANKVDLSSQLDTIFNNINDPDEKRNSNTPYGNYFYDVYNYLAGSDSFSPSAVPETLADELGYSQPFTKFASPLTLENSCAETIVVFIGNPNSSGPTNDSEANTLLLEDLGGSTTQLNVPDFTTVSSDPESVTLVEQTACLDRRLSSLDCIEAAGVAAVCDAGAGIYTSCSCDLIGKEDCTGNTRRFSVSGIVETFSIVPTGTFSAPAKSNVNADEWAKFLYSKGIPFDDGSAAGTRRTVRTYTIDVFNKQQNADHTSLLLSMARVGGGRYFAARNENSIVDAILEIFSDVQAVNSTFASASLPISATNRAQNENQVFIGMFRPDPDARPRWFGNLKRYQLIGGAGIQLGDVNGSVAVNPLTGFLTECSQSFWSFDSGPYWENLGINPSPASLCDSSETNAFSDAPDGPRVEKGGAAQIARSGNNPPSTSTSPTYVEGRNVLTRTGTKTIANFTAETSGLSEDLVNFIRGTDVNNEKGDGETSLTRPSLHGDVIHSRPQPVNYGGDTGVVVFYGANDGLFHAVSGEDGREIWSFVAPEFFSKLSRLSSNSPSVSFPGLVGDGSEKPKDYFFDGSVGLRQSADGENTVLYASMRRGGRSIYAFDVTTPETPSISWVIGCPSLDNDEGCSSDMEEIGQTWSTPAPAPVKGYNSGSNPVLFIGGGYDDCEDEDTELPDCTDAKGAAVFVVDADTGNVVEKYSTERPVTADPALVDFNQDGAADFAYFVDLGGNVYRLSLVDYANNFDELDSALWRFDKIAKTEGFGRKFQFAPALLATGSRYVFLALGSGDREHPLVSQYPSTQSVVNRFYVFYDDFAVSSTLNLDEPPQMADYTDVAEEDEERAAIIPGGALRGWFMDLPGSGEQTVTSAIIVSGKVAFSTNRPVPAAEFSCGTNLGEARGYLVNLLDAEGTIGEDDERSSEFTGGGLPPSPVIARVPVDGELTTVLIGVAQEDGSTSSSIESQRVRPDTSNRRNRVYWYQSGND